MSGVMEARADSNGGANIVVANNSATRPRSGTRGMTMAATRTIRIRSQTSMTERRGRRSAQEQAADHPGQVPGRVGHAGEQRVMGPVIDQQDDRDQGQPVAGYGQYFREPQGPEFAYREHVTECGPRRHSTFHCDLSVQTPYSAVRMVTHFHHDPPQVYTATSSAESVTHGWINYKEQRWRTRRPIRRWAGSLETR